MFKAFFILPLIFISTYSNASLVDVDLFIDANTGSEQLAGSIVADNNNSLFQPYTGNTYLKVTEVSFTSPFSGLSYTQANTYLAGLYLNLDLNLLGYFTNNSSQIASFQLGSFPNKTRFTFDFSGIATETDFISSTNIGSFRLAVAQISEPSILSLMILGLIGFARLRLKTNTINNQLIKS